MPVARWAPCRLEQKGALFQRRECFPGSADRQDMVPSFRLLEAVDEVGCEVSFADRLAGRFRTLAEDDEGLAGPDPVDLARERFEERCRPDNRPVCQASLGSPLRDAMQEITASALTSLSAAASASASVSSATRRSQPSGIEAAASPGGRRTGATTR